MNTTFNNDKKVISLTFDDGPNTTVTPLVLDLMEQYGIVGSFFLVGNNINPDSAMVMKRAVDMGCTIESHSLTHSVMSDMDAGAIKYEMYETARRIVDVIGEQPKFFRPPYIAVNDTLYDAVDLPFICGEGCDDWNPEVSVETRISAILEMARDGLIVLLHDSAENYATVEALKVVIPKLLEDGYEFCTVRDLFEIKGEIPVGGRLISYL